MAFVKVRIDGIPSIWERESVDIVAQEHGFTESVFYMKDSSLRNKGWAVIVYKSEADAANAKDIIAAQHGLQCQLLSKNVNVEKTDVELTGQMGVDDGGMSHIGSPNIVPQGAAQYLKYHTEEAERRRKKREKRGRRRVEMETVTMCDNWREYHNEGLIPASDSPELRNWDYVEKHDGAISFYVHCETGEKKWNLPGSDGDVVERIMQETLKGPPGTNLHIFQFPTAWSEVTLYQHFCHFGPIRYLKMERDAKTGRNLRQAVLSYETRDQAISVWKGMSNFQIGTKRLSVQPYVNDDGALEDYEIREGIVVKFNRGMLKMNPLEIAESTMDNGKKGTKKGQKSLDDVVLPGEAPIGTAATMKYGGGQKGTNKFGFEGKHKRAAPY